MAGFRRDGHIYDIMIFLDIEISYFDIYSIYCPYVKASSLDIRSKHQTITFSQQIEL